MLGGQLGCGITAARNICSVTTVCSSGDAVIHWAVPAAAVNAVAVVSRMALRQGLQ